MGDEDIVGQKWKACIEEGATQKKLLISQRNVCKDAVQDMTILVYESYKEVAIK